MRRPELARALFVLALGCASLVVPRAEARAGGLGSLYTDLVCRELAGVPGEFDFKTSFVGLADCDSLCLKAGLVCRRAVLDAAKCQVAFASDFIGFDSKLDCSGLTGSRLRDCKAGWLLDLQAWRSQISGQVNNALFGCAQAAGTCSSNCSAH
jgi:hypothetical protein